MSNKHSLFQVVVTGTGIHDIHYVAAIDVSDAAELAFKKTEEGLPKLYNGIDEKTVEQLQASLYVSNITTLAKPEDFLVANNND